MKPIHEVTACVVDHGLFTHIALAMAEQCERVFYCGPNEKVMRRFEDDVVGDGFDNIIRIESPFQVEHLADVFVFPDTGFRYEQLKLLKDGRAVWGHHGADVLEVNKGRFLDVLKELDMEVPPHTIIHGFDNLMSHLRGKEDKWVKVSKWRGDWETFHWRNQALDGDYLRGHPYNRCPARSLFTFYVFDKIDTPIEDGVDTWCIDGKWPKNVLHAMERKDKSLIGAIQPLSEIHESVRVVNEVFGPYLGEKFGYRGAFSTEVRPPYFIDPTCRFGSPPSQLQSVLIKNLPDVIYRGAHGELVEPIHDDVFGGQVFITADREKDEYLTLDLDQELRPFVKSAFCFEVDGIARIAPNPLENWAGWLVATGKSVRQIVDLLKERKEMLPPGFDCDISSMADLLRSLEDAEKKGIEISEQPVPEPEIVL